MCRWQWLREKISFQSVRDGLKCQLHRDNNERTDGRTDGRYTQCAWVIIGRYSDLWDVTHTPPVILRILRDYSIVINRGFVARDEIGISYFNGWWSRFRRRHTSSVEWPACSCHFCTVFVCFQETFKNAFVSPVILFIFFVFISRLTMFIYLQI